MAIVSATPFINHTPYADAFGISVYIVPVASSVARLRSHRAQPPAFS